MSERARTRRIRHELERIKAELTRQDRELAEAIADVDLDEEQKVQFADLLRGSAEKTPPAAPEPLPFNPHLHALRV